MLSFSALYSHRALFKTVENLPTTAFLCSAHEDKNLYRTVGVKTIKNIKRVNQCIFFDTCTSKKIDYSIFTHIILTSPTSQMPAEFWNCSLDDARNVTIFSSNKSVEVLLLDKLQQCWKINMKKRFENEAARCKEIMDLKRKRDVKGKDLVRIRNKFKRLNKE